MSCSVCGGRAVNIGAEGEKVLVHDGLGDCWEPYFHPYTPKKGKGQKLQETDVSDAGTEVK
jgi:hypothetical protein